VLLTVLLKSSELSIYYHLILDSFRHILFTLEAATATGQKDKNKLEGSFLEVVSL